MQTVAAFDSGNLLAVATALHQRWPDKRIMIAGDDDHKLENNPGRVKALEASLAVRGMVVFPNLTAEQREKGLTDFNDLALENPRLAEHQLEDAVWRARQRDDEQTKEIGKGLVRLDSRAGRREIPCEILKETPHRFLVRLGEDCVLPRGREATKGQEVYVPKDAVERIAELSMEATIEERDETSLGSGSNCGGRDGFCVAGESRGCSQRAGAGRLLGQGAL